MLIIALVVAYILVGAYAFMSMYSTNPNQKYYMLGIGALVVNAVASIYFSLRMYK